MLGQVPVQSVKQTIKDIENLRKMGFRGVIVNAHPRLGADFGTERYEALYQRVYKRMYEPLRPLYAELQDILHPR